MMQLRSTATSLGKMLALAALCLLPLAAAHGGTNKATGDLDISICDDLLWYVWQQAYGSHQSLEAACTCEVASFIDMFQGTLVDGYGFVCCCGFVKSCSLLCYVRLVFCLILLLAVAYTSTTTRQQSTYQQQQSTASWPIVRNAMTRLLVTCA